MSQSIRLDDKLVRDAGIEGSCQKRSLPKQIEYWAEIGRSVERFVTSSDLLALMQGYAQVSVTPRPSNPVSPQKVFDALERDYEQGTAERKVTKAGVWYEASRSRPGLLDRVQPDGMRETGHFREGKFIPSS